MIPQELRCEHGLYACGCETDPSEDSQEDDYEPNEFAGQGYPQDGYR